MRLYQYTKLSTFIDLYTSKKHGNREAECCGQAFHRESLPRIGVLLGVRKRVCETMAMAGGGVRVSIGHSGRRVSLNTLCISCGYIHRNFYYINSLFGSVTGLIRDRFHDGGIQRPNRPQTRRNIVFISISNCNSRKTLLNTN